MSNSQKNHDQSHQRAFKGIWIPAEIWLHPDLSFMEKTMWAEIDSLSGVDGCFASNEYFANFFGVQTTYISKVISRLIKLGLVEKVSFDGHRRVIKSLRPPQKKNLQTTESNNKAQKSGLHKSASLGCTKVQPSQYIYNKENNNNSAAENLHFSGAPQAPPVVVIFSSLEKLKLSNSQKIELSKSWTEKEIDIAVQRCLEWSSSSSDLKKIRTVLKNRDSWIDENLHQATKTTCNQQPKTIESMLESNQLHQTVYDALKKKRSKNG